MTLSTVDGATGPVGTGVATGGVRSMGGLGQAATFTRLGGTAGSDDNTRDTYAVSGDGRMRRAGAQPSRNRGLWRPRPR